MAREGSEATVHYESLPTNVNRSGRLGKTGVGYKIRRGQEQGSHKTWRNDEQRPINHTLATITLIVILTSKQLSTVANAERILLLPLNTYAHIKIMTLASTELLKAGHDVWMLSGLPPVSHTHHPTHGKIQWLKIDLLSLEELLMDERSCQGEDSRGCYELFFGELTRMAYGHCRTILTNQELMRQLRNMTFDLAIYDGIHVYSCVSILPYMLNITYVSLSIQHNGWVAGVPSLPSVEPHQFTSFSSDMTLIQRMSNILIHIAAAVFIPFTQPERALLQEVVPRDAPLRTIREVQQNTALWLTFTEPTCLDYPRAAAPYYVQINMPTAHYDPRRVPIDLQQFVDSANSGLIIVTFGTLASDGRLSAEKREIFVKTFRRFPNRKFVLNYSPDATFNVTELPENIYAMEWVPVDELLAHRNTRALINHGGHMSINEAVQHGIPVIVIPFLADQGYNAKRAVQNGWGIALDRSKLSVESLSGGLRAILNDPAYVQSASFCQSILNRIPSGQESVAFWVEYLFAYGHRHLYSGRSKLSIAKILMLDLNVAIIAIIGSVLFVTLKFLWACAFLWNRTKRKYPGISRFLWPSVTFLFFLSLAHSILTGSQV